MSFDVVKLRLILVAQHQIDVVAVRPWVLDVLAAALLRVSGFDELVVDVRPTRLKGFDLIGNGNRMPTGKGDRSRLLLERFLAIHEPLTFTSRQTIATELLGEGVDLAEKRVDVLGQCRDLVGIRTLVIVDYG